MPNNDRLKIIDAIEQASEAELKQLALINESLSALAGRSATGVPASTTTTGSVGDTPELVITRSLSRSRHKNKVRIDDKDHSRQKSTVERNKTNAHATAPSESDEAGGKKNQKSTVEKTKTERVSTSEKQLIEQSSENAKNVPYKRTLYRARLATAGESAKRGNPKPARPQRVTEDTKASTPSRGANGRFLSRDKSEATEKIRLQKLSQKEQDKMQAGFFGKLGKLISGDSAIGGKGESGAGGELVGGAVVGGPIWTLGKGMFDLSKAVGDNAVSMKKWMSGKDDDEPNVPEPAKIQPPVIVQPPAAPTLGKPQSAMKFAGGNHDAAANATIEQTRVIDENDDRIVDALDGIRREIKRQGKGGDGMGGLKGLLSRRSMPGRNGRNGRNARNGKDGNRGRRNNKSKRSGKFGQTDSLQTDKSRNRSRPGKTAKAKTSLGKAPGGKLKAILGRKTLKVAGGMAATGALATTAAVQLPEKAAAIATQKAATQAAKAAAPAARVTEKAITTAAKPAAEATAKTAAAAVGTGTAAAGTTAAAKAVSTVGEKTAESTATKTAEATAAKTAAKTAETTATKTATEAGEVATKKGALSVGSKLGAKTALKAIPLIGTAIGVGLDAYDGATDEEGQREAFKVEEGKEVSKQQKTAYTMANVLNMGGLVSGVAGLMASGASAMGMDKVADALTFDTASMAKGLDSGMTSVRDAVTKVTESTDGQSKAVTTALSDQTLAINAGTDKTVGAINRLGTQMQGGEWGQDNVGAEGRKVSDYAAVAVDNISPDLNIGGKNAKVRSFRNNNFGNLNYVGQEGARLEDPNGKGEARFAKFNTPEEGFRGLANQLTLYANGKSKATGGRKLETVEDIISVYAPSNENNTQQYISSLSTKLGVQSNEKLDMTSPEVMTQLMRGIATIEGGNPQVTDQFIRDSIGRHENGKWVGGKFSDQSLKVVNEERSKKGLAPVAANSLYSTGSKVVTAQGGAEAIRPATPANAPVTASTPAVPAPDAPAILPAVAPIKHSLSPVSSAAAATLPLSVVAPAAASNAANSTATQALATVAPVTAAAAPTQPLSASHHEAQREKQEKAKEVKVTAGEDSVTSRFKSMMSKGMTAVSGAVGQGDAWVQEIMQDKGIEGMSKNRPTAELTLPAGVTLPAALANAARAPAEIAKQTKAYSAQGIASKKPTVQNTANPINTPTEISPVAAGETMANIPGASATPEEPGMFSRAMSGAMDGLKAVGASIMPAVGDTLNQTVSGFSGTQIVSDLMGQAGLTDPSLQRAISPIADKAGNWMEGGMNTVKEASTAFFNGNLPEAQMQTQIREQPSSLAIPTTMQTVQDLARSGVRPSLSSDNTANHDVDMLKELKAMSGTLAQILGVTKQKDDAPAKVVNTAQPAPRKEAALAIKDDALSELLRD